MTLKEILLFPFPRTTEKIDSEFNGEIKVTKQFGNISVRVGGLEQSGPMVERLWEHSFKSIPKEAKGMFEKKGREKGISVLVLGFGAGSVVKPLRRHFESLRITAVDIDSVMVKLAKNLLSKDERKDINVVECDARDFLREDTKRYDLLIVDMYRGSFLPRFIYEDDFLRSLKGKMREGGILLLNHIYDKRQRKRAENLRKKIEDIFGKKNTLATRTIVNLIILAIRTPD